MAELRTRVIEAVGSGSRSITMDIVQTDEGSVYANIMPFLNGTLPDSEFIAMSHRLVHRLVQSQHTQLIPGGMVLIFQGHTGITGRKCIGIIKADKLSGFTISKNNNVTVMDFLNNLVLTPGQKLYKAALAVRQSDGETGTMKPEDVSVAVFDSNNNKSQSNASANYFYDMFLGCAYQKNSDVLTRDFFNYTKEFINQKSDLIGPQKMDAMSALYVYMKVSTEPTVSVSSFACSYFNTPEIKDAYRTYMIQKKYPATEVRKDISMIVNSLRKRKIRFSARQRTRSRGSAKRVLCA